jgi:hypothetical protein
MNFLHNFFFVRVVIRLIGAETNPTMCNTIKIIGVSSGHILLRLYEITELTERSSYRPGLKIIELLISLLKNRG